MMLRGQAFDAVQHRRTLGGVRGCGMCERVWNGIHEALVRLKGDFRGMHGVRGAAPCVGQQDS
eukprot:39434-Chlamydomonas_euryale.AAC.1